jgi:Cap4 dsDNA endonuclease
MSNSSPPPDQILGRDDPGDDTARRYRFQWTWAAITCCAMLDDTDDIVEVFCEQHEDVLIKHRDGKFSGHQVKTRESDQPVWKASDAQIKSAFARFVKLDGDFPGFFRAFRFLTGHPLHSAGNARSLPYVLRQIGEAPTVADLPSPVARWLRLVAKEADATDVAAFHALKKATARDDLPKLQDSLIRLVDSLTECWPAAEDCSHAAVRRAAQALIDECERASALDHEQVLPTYIIALQDPTATVEACITGKRMTSERVRNVLTNGLASVAPLAGDPEGCVGPGLGSTALLLQKLDAGGFSAVSRNSAEDLRDKADYLGIAWTKKQGRTKGLVQYEHVRSLALNDAARAFEATKTDGEQFGPAMREYLRDRFKERRAQGENLFDCTDEHLEGIAYSLTAQCKVQWSLDRPWEAS